MLYVIEDIASCVLILYFHLDWGNKFGMNVSHQNSDDDLQVLYRGKYDNLIMLSRILGEICFWVKLYG